MGVQRLPTGSVWAAPSAEERAACLHADRLERAAGEARRAESANAPALLEEAQAARAEHVRTKPFARRWGSVRWRLEKAEAKLHEAMHEDVKPILAGKKLRLFGELLNLLCLHF